jgi:hypothetical protein
MKCTCCSENEIPLDKSGKMTASPIKTLGFQDRLSGIALSFDFVNFVKKKNLFEIFPRIHVSFPVTSEKFCYFIGHLKGFSQTVFFSTSDFGYYD